MRGFILSFICVLCFSISGCMNTIKNVPVIASTGTTAYYGHDVVVNVIETNLDIFSPRELDRLEKANDRLCIAKGKLDAIIERKDGDITKLVMDLPTLVPLYDEVKKAYLAAYSIIMDRVDEFSAADRSVLMRYSDTCERLDGAIQVALMDDSGASNAQLVRDIMVFVVLVGKIILPMLIAL